MEWKLWNQLRDEYSYEVKRTEDDGSDPRALIIIGMGTEQGRNGSHENHRPFCKFLFGSCPGYPDFNQGLRLPSITKETASTYLWMRLVLLTGEERTLPFSSLSQEIVRFWSGGHMSVLLPTALKFLLRLITHVGRRREFSFSRTTRISRGFHPLFLKVTRNVDPSLPGLNETGSWKVWDEAVQADGSKSVVAVRFALHRSDKGQSLKLFKPIDPAPRSPRPLRRISTELLDTNHSRLSHHRRITLSMQYCASKVVLQTCHKLGPRE